MAIFIIDSLNYGSQAAKLVAQLEEHVKNDIKKPIVNFSLETIKKQILEFNSMLAKQVEDQIVHLRDAEGKVTDAFNNEWLGHYAYRYYEIVYNNKNTIDRIRYLGPSGLGSNRFQVENIVNPFTYVTVMNLAADIREITKSTLLLNIEQLFTCKRDAWKNDSEIMSGKTMPPYRYSWDYLEKNYFSPRAKYNSNASMTEAEINAIIKKNEDRSIQDKEKLEQYLITIEANKKDIANKAEKQIEKSQTPLDWWTQEYKQTVANFSGSMETIGKESGKMVAKFIDKFSIGCIIEEALKCLIPEGITCKRLFENLPAGQFMDRLKTVFPQGNDTLRQIELIIEKEIFGTDFYNAKKEIEDLKKWIEEDKSLLYDLRAKLIDSPDNEKILSQISNLENKISEKEIKIQEHEETIFRRTEEVAPDLKLSERQKEEITSNGGNISAIFSLPTDDEQIGPQALTIKILAAIDTIIPIEDVCEAITNAISFSWYPPFVNFDGLPPFEFPKPRPVKDIMGGGLQLNEVFARLLTQSLISLIDGILADLINCDTLDTFIAQAMDGAIRGKQSEDLKNLFSQDRINSIVEENYDRFVDNISGKTSSIFTAGTNNEVKIGLSQGATEAILKGEPLEPGDFIGAERSVPNIFEAAESQATWDIDVTGTKFETIYGTRVFDTTEIDKFFANLDNETKALLLENGKYTSRAMSDSLNIDIKIRKETTVTGELVLTPDERNSLKEEVNCIMRHITSVLMPSQVLDLLAGRASEKTKQMAYEIIKISCETPVVDGLFREPDAFADMFKVFGSASGLDKLKDEIEVLADSPQIKNSIPLQKCGPYENINIFREQLLSKTIDREDAKKIIENLDNERINRYNEISNKVMDMSKGKLYSDNESDPSDVLLQSIKDAFEGNGVRQNNIKITDTNSNKNIQQIIQEEIDIQISSSPIIQDMFRIVKDSFFLPIEQIFNDDIQSITDAMGDIVEVNEPIERLLKVETPNGDVVEVINPEFKRMIDVGLVPIVNKNSDKYAKMVDKKNLNIFNLTEELRKLPLGIGDFIAGIVPDLTFMLDNARGRLGFKAGKPKYYISGDSNADFVKKGFNGIDLKPIVKKMNKKIIGNDMKRNLQNIKIDSLVTNSELIINVVGQSITVEGEAISNTSLAKSVPLPEDPSWNIKFEENINRRNELQNIYGFLTSGSYITSINGREDFYVKEFEFIEKMNYERSMSKFLRLRYNNDEPKTRKFIFDDIIFENLRPLLAEGNTSTIFEEFENSSSDIYSNIVEGYIKTIAEDIANTDLLKPVSAINPNLTKLEALNFIQDCFHVMNFKDDSRDFDIIYSVLSKIPRNPPTKKQLLGLEKRESPIAETTKLILCKILVKVLCLDIILKALPAFDYYMYSGDLIDNEMMKALVMSFVESDLERLSKNNKIDMKDFVHQNLTHYYKSVYPELVTTEKRIEFANKNVNHTLEMELFVQQQFPEILKQIKKIVGKDDNSNLSVDDFLKLFLQSLPVLDVHNHIGTDRKKRDRILQESEAADGGIILQRYMFFPKINRRSKVVRNNRYYFTEEKLKELDNIGIVNFDQAFRIIEEIRYVIREDFDLYVCNGDRGYSDRLFEEPYQVGLRIVNVVRKEDNRPSIVFNDREYPYSLDRCLYTKSGYITEENRISYDLLVIAEERYRINQKDEAEAFLGRRNLERYNMEFYQNLFDRLLEDEEVNLMFCYAIPLKEIASILIHHTQLANNTKKMKYLFEPTKKSIKRMADFLENTGNDTLSSERLREAMMKIQREKENVGNPAGPLDFSALKMFYRTPIHILKGVAIASDPNIALTDKIISGISLVSTLASSIPPIPGVPPPPKIPIPPYGLVSLALLPFPLFTPPPAGIIPPLTSYNIGSPIGPIFLALEPLLWDLPFYKIQNSETIFGSQAECEDSEE